MIYIRLPLIPPSSNHAYSTIRGTNKRVLTKEGKAFKTEVITTLAQKYPKQLATIKKDVGYFVGVRFVFDTIVNKGWPDKAESKYKKIDVSNRVKLLEDALKEACGIDDSQHIAVFLMKAHSGKGEYTEIWMEEFDAKFIQDFVSGLDSHVPTMQ